VEVVVDGKCGDTSEIADDDDDIAFPIAFDCGDEDDDGDNKTPPGSF
jgi:hypothetical protein